MGQAGVPPTIPWYVALKKTQIAEQSHLLLSWPTLTVTQRCTTLCDIGKLCFILRENYYSFKRRLIGCLKPQ